MLMFAMTTTTTRTTDPRPLLGGGGAQTTNTQEASTDPFFREYGDTITRILLLVLAIFVSHLVYVFADATGITENPIEAALFVFFLEIPLATALVVVGSRELALESTPQAKFIYYLGLLCGWVGVRIVAEAWWKFDNSTHWLFYTVYALGMIAGVFWYGVMKRIIVPPNDPSLASPSLFSTVL